MKRHAPLRRPWLHARRQRRAPPMPRPPAAWRRVRWRWRRPRAAASALRVAPLRRLKNCRRLPSGVRSMLLTVSMGPLGFVEVTAAEQMQRPGRRTAQMQRPGLLCAKCAPCCLLYAWGPLVSWRSRRLRKCRDLGCPVLSAERALRLRACREAEEVRSQLQAAGTRAEAAEAAAASARAAAAATAQRDGERIRGLEVTMCQLGPVLCPEPCAPSRLCMLQTC